MKWHGRRPPATTLPPREAYARWASSYPPAPHNVLMAVEQEAVLAALPDVAGRRVLDAGCGTGRYLEVLARRGAARLVGLDFSPEMLGRVPTPGAWRVLGSLSAVPVQAASVDVVVSGLALNDVEDLDAALAELARVLRPGGTLVYSVIHPRGGRLGWMRSFQTEAGTAAVAGCWHDVETHRRACDRAGLLVELVRDVAAVGSPIDGPVALVIRARKAA